MLLPATLYCQKARVDLPELEFARFDKNHLVMAGDTSSFEALFKKMDGVLFEGSGNLRILHVGGSHVQAGTLTRQFRNDMLALRPGLDGGRGLVFPFTAARTNNPSSFRTRYEGEWKAYKNVMKDLTVRLGLTGMALSTTDTAAMVRIVLKARNATPADPDFRFDKVGVLGYCAEGGMFPVVVLESGDTIPGIRDEKTSCWNFSLPEPRDSVTVRVAGGEGELTVTGIYLDNPSSGITVSGVGVNGAALRSYLRCEDLKRDLATVRPDLVIFAVGINDASGKEFHENEFISRYKAFVTYVRSVNPECAILFVTNNDCYRRVRRRVYAVNRNTPRVEEAFLRIATDCGGAVWDLFDVMGGLGSMKDWEEAGLAKRDKIHFTDEGYTIVGDLLYNALMAKYVEHLRRRMEWD